MVSEPGAAESALSHVHRLTKVDLDTSNSQIANRLVTEDGYCVFDNVTGNQIITLDTFRSLPEDKQQSSLALAVALARKLEYELEPVESDAKENLLGLVVDILTVNIVIMMRPYLETSKGTVMAQVYPSVISSATAIVAHARRLATLFELLTQRALVNHQICVKIPATVEGLQACRILDTNYNIRTLATTVFSTEQGLAASQAGCRFVAPYVNPLEAFFYEAEGVPMDRRSLTNTKVSIEMILELQAALRSQKSSTEVLAAAILTDVEVLSIVGVDRVTIGPGVLEQLARPIEPKDISLTEQSTATLQRLEKGQRSWPKDWFTGDGLAQLQEAIESKLIKAMLQDSLSRFASAEQELRGLATTSL